jgi:hypothetical protein
MQHAIRTISGCLAIGLFSFACSSGDGGSRGESGPTIDEVPPLYAAAACEAVQGCMGTLTPLFFNGDCVAQLTRALEDGDFPALQAAVRAGTIEYHPSAVQGCFDEVAGSGCDFPVSNHSVACEAALTGTLPEGGDCTVDDECEGDLQCEISGACPGSCRPRAAAGGPCAESSDCADGLVCPDAGGNCAAPVAEGLACSDALPCALPALCLGGTCVDLAAAKTGSEGDVCSLVTWELCAEGSYCSLTDATGGTCTGERALSGGDCVLTLPDQCPSDEFCDTTAGPPAQCRPLPVDGAACAPERFGSRCAVEHVCVAVGADELCRAMQRNGGSCSVDDECYSKHCAAGACASPDACE